MAGGPWFKYQQAPDASAGPWLKYRGAAPADPAAAAPPPAPAIPLPGRKPSLRAIQERRSITGPSEGGAQDWLVRQQAIESRLRAAGKTDAEIQQDPEWQEAARNLSSSVTSGVNGTATAAALGDVGGPALSRALGPLGRIFDRGAADEIAARAAASAQPTVTRPPSAAAAVARRLVPGASARARDAVSDIGETETPSELGQRMHGTLMKRFQVARAARARGTDALRHAFLARADTAAPILNDYREALAKLASDKGGDLSKEERRLIQQSASEMKGPRSLEAIEKERRRLNDIAAGNWEGGSAVKQAFAKNLADRLTAIMQKHNPEFGKYLTDYRQLSEPINLYTKTLLGRAATRESAGIPATDIAAIPKRFFNTRQSVETLRKLSGDDEFVNGAARIHAASQLEARTAGRPVAAAARQARTWAERNKDWLNALPSVRDSVDDFVSELERTAKTQRTAKVGAGAAVVATLLHEGMRPYYWVRHLLGLP